MKLLFLFPLLFALTLHASENPPGGTHDLDRMREQAMALMEDVAPHSPVSKDWVKISNPQCNALWGPIFGDKQIGALVAVHTRDLENGGDDMLCLLLWKDGWKFAQWVGGVSSVVNNDPDPDIDWGIKRIIPGGTCYVMDSLCTPYATSREHSSWFCDPHTHSLRHTGWPRDARPSISGSTITFQRENADSHTVTYEIDQFDGAPGKNIATYSMTQGERNAVFVTVTLPDQEMKKNVTWIIWRTFANYDPSHDSYLLGYNTTGEKLPPLHQDAAIDIQWGNDLSKPSITFLLWRLTGLSSAALHGRWDDDIQRDGERGYSDVEIPKPTGTIVAGIPEALKAFSWPLPAPSEKAAPTK